MTLADLDESAWSLFGDRACRELARLVVAAISRGSRLLMHVGAQPLPKLPKGISLEELNLEVRTVNALVQAGIHQRPQDLDRMTVDDLLGLRGFWSKSLVDLLTAMEFVIDHPEVPRKRRRLVASTSRQHRSANRFPQPNRPVAPAILKDLLDQPIPRDLTRGTRFPGKRLADLDETVWDYFAPEVIAQLAALVLAQIGAKSIPPAVRSLPLPDISAGLRLEDLHLENRTVNSLEQANLARDMQQFSRMTVGDLVALPGFGVRCLVDLLVALETLVVRQRSIGDELLRQAKRLAALPAASTIHFNDPRLGRLLRTLDKESSSLAEFLQRIRRRKLDGIEPLKTAEGFDRLVNTITGFQEMTVEDELRSIFSPMANDRDQAILASYYNWDGQGRHTLEQIGQTHGLSRERIRQICLRCTQRVRFLPVYAPVFDRTLSFIAKRLPRSTDAMEHELQKAGLSRHGLSITAIEETAPFLSRTATFHVVPVAEGAIAVAPDQTDLPPQIAQAAKIAVGNFGVATVSDVQTVLNDSLPNHAVGPRLIRETLATFAGFHWLDARRHWFRIETPAQCGLPNMIEKVVSVAECISISRLRTAILRYRRCNRSIPPSGALLEYCRTMPNVRVEDDMVCAEPSLDWRTLLADVERCMVQVLKESGPVLERSQFEQRCIALGMNRFSFNAIVMCSPVITQYDRSVYGLVAQQMDPQIVRSAAEQRSQLTTDHVLQTCGIDGDDRTFVVYRLSKAAITGGVLTIPAALKDHVAGEYAVVSPVHKQIGRIVAKQGCGWGFGPVLRGSGAEPGHYLHLHFDNSNRTATLRLTDANVAGNA